MTRYIIKIWAVAQIKLLMEREHSDESLIKIKIIQMDSI
jgi:hypothetical protein